jgi:hypothetical protein
MKTQENNTTNNRRNKQWLRNRNQRKNPKIFSAQFIQLKDGSFHLLGGESKVLVRKNQVAADWQKVDTRDLATEMRLCGVKSH